MKAGIDWLISELSVISYQPSAISFFYELSYFFDNKLVAVAKKTIVFTLFTLLPSSPLPFLMSTTKNFFIALIFTGWLVFIATFSIQNIELITVNFLVWESVKIPVGVFLSMMIASGFLLGAILPAFFRRKPKSSKKRSPRNDFRRQPEVEEESDPIFDW